MKGAIPATFADRNRAMKRITALKYFLENTTHEWFLSATDDIVVDINGLEIMIKELEEQYNPLDDYVFKGHCIFNIERYYLQGGSGYLFSRCAAYAFYKEYAFKWLDGIQLWDDVFAYRIADFLEIKIKDTSSPYMFGVRFPGPLEMEKPYLLNRITNECPDNPVSDGECHLGLVPLTKLAILHTSPTRNTSIIFDNILKIRSQANDLYYYNDGITMKICRGKPYINDDFDPIHFIKNQTLMGDFYYNDNDDEFNITSNHTFINETFN